jgi:hypothetical protein
MLDNDPGGGLTWGVANGAITESALPSWKRIGATAHPWLRVYYEGLSFWTRGITVGHHLTSSELLREGWTWSINQLTKKPYSGTGKQQLSQFSDKSLKRFKAEPFERMVTKEGNGALTRRSAKKLTYQQYPITIILSDVDLDSSLGSARWCFL